MKPDALGPTRNKPLSLISEGNRNIDSAFTLIELLVVMAVT
jgi:type II secretory pathway pseudopilin PulG